MLLLLFVLFRFESKRRGKDGKELGYQWGNTGVLKLLGLQAQQEALASK